MYIAKACIQFFHHILPSVEVIEDFNFYFFPLTPVGKLTYEEMCFQDCQSE